MTLTFAALSIPGAFFTGLIWGHVATLIHRASAPRVVRLHRDDRERLRSVEAMLRMARIRAVLIELQGWHHAD